MTRFSTVFTAIAALSCVGCSTTSASRGNSNASTEVIPLQYVDASIAAEQLRSEHAGARIVAQPSMNAIIVVGSSAEVGEIRRAVSRVDQPG